MSEKISFSDSANPIDAVNVSALNPLPVVNRIVTTATLSNVAGSATNVTVLAANANRIGAVIVNDSAAILLLKFGATASATSFTYRLDAYSTLELPVMPLYKGIIDGIWASATGSARVTEYS